MDWLDFFTAHHIEFADRGENVSTGNVVISCPFCDDSGKHMSVSTNGKGWSCWRCKEHGKQPARLIVSLISCSWEEAHRLGGSTTTYLPTSLVEDVRAKLGSGMGHGRPRARLKIPLEFRNFNHTHAASRPYRNYLIERGIPERRMKDLTWKYKLHWTSRGVFGGRIIFPVFSQGSLVTWTGRTIGNSGIRYKTLTEDADIARRDGLTPAEGPITNYLLWEDELRKGGDILVCVEGPFDALNIRVMSNDAVMATCFFTSTASAEQKSKLYEILPRFNRKFLLLDKGTAGVTMSLASELSSLGIEPRYLEDIKDPGTIASKTQLLKILLGD